MNLFKLFNLGPRSLPSCTPLQSKLHFYSVMNNLHNIKAPLLALQAINHNHLNSFELRRLFKATTRLRPVNKRSIELASFLYSKLDKPNYKDLRDLTHLSRVGAIDESFELFSEEYKQSNLVDLLALAAKLPNKQLYHQLFDRLQALKLDFDYRVVVVHMFQSSNKFGYLNRVFKHINHGLYDDGQLRHILFKIICLLLEGELSSYGNNVIDAMVLLEEWNRSFFGVASNFSRNSPPGSPKSSTHPIFSLSNYDGLPSLNRPLTPAYLVIMQKAAEAGELSTCFNILRDLVDSDALIDRLASDSKEKTRMKSRLETFQPLAVPLNTYITLYEVCKTTTQQTIEQRRHLLLQLHTYFLDQTSFAIIKGRNIILLDKSRSLSPSPRQTLTILSTFFTVFQDKTMVLRVWQELRGKFRKHENWNRVERFHGVRRMVFDCRDDLSSTGKVPPRRKRRIIGKSKENKENKGKEIEQPNDRDNDADLESDIDIPTHNQTIQQHYK
ncbi:hypothetical protein E3P99_00222 [Wallemia hederae]|uniref:Uncharacterized protein n=1 Tax=Wallemia hederae TaxID=1540922 RepID=A0A4T0FYI0_9BASI|nr:hypothetical protein E3P99_00222 [Wallemia hederae]